MAAWNKRSPGFLAFAALTLCLTLLAFYIRVHDADYFHYNVDEIMHQSIAEGRDIREVWRFSLLETHPPLGHFIRHFWIMLDGSPAFSRLLSLLFGMATLALYFIYGCRTDGRLAGFSCLALAAFSYGLIIQSYVVRNYSMFVFFLSYAYFSYLSWREDNTRLKSLAWFGLFSTLACLTHFSGIFALFVLMATECALFHKHKRSLHSLALMLGASLPAFLAFLATWLLWRDTLAPVQHIATESLGDLPLSHAALLLGAYPLHVFDYLFPGSDFLLVLAFLIPQAWAARHKPELFLLSLAAAALLLGMLLFITGIYPFAGDRHGLWLLPFWLFPSGLMLARFARTYIRSPLAGALAVMIICGACYGTNGRFSDPLEYKISQKTWEETSAYLNALDGHTLLISGRTDAIMLSPPRLNIYNFIGDVPESISANAALIPYYHTHLLFNNRRVMRLYDSASLLALLNDAQKAGLFKTYDRLIFVNSYSVSLPIAKLAACRELDKKVIVFPSGGNGIGSASDVSLYTAVFLEVNARDFMDEVLAPNGKAHHCLYGASK